MSSFTGSDPSAGSAERPVPTVSFEEIDAAMMRARRLRAEAVADGAAWLWRSSARIFTRRRADERAHSAMSSLAALRSSAEILRDNPEIGPDQRRRLIDIVLAEEARLERLFGRFGRRSRPEKAA